MPLTDFLPTIEPFAASPLAPGGDLQTIIGYYWPVNASVDHQGEEIISLPDGDRLLAYAHESTRGRGVVVLLHGLGGDADAPYMRRLAKVFTQDGWHVLRVNHRGAGAGRKLARRIYHSGRSEDVSAVLLHAAQKWPGLPLFAAGFSLSGNMLLKLLGEAAEPVSPALRAAMAVCPPADLSLCARALRRRRNKIYDLRFVRKVMKNFHERRTDFPDDFPPPPPVSTLYQIDNLLTAPLAGYESAEDYYQHCQSKPHLHKIAVPTLLLASDDDPFIPPETFAGIPENQQLLLHLTRSGGHLGFIHARKTAHGHRRWMDYTLLAFVQWVFLHMG